MSLNNGTLAPDRADPGAVEATVTSVHAKSRRLRVVAGHPADSHALLVLFVPLAADDFHQFVMEVRGLLFHFLERDLPRRGIARL